MKSGLFVLRTRSIAGCVLIVAALSVHASASAQSEDALIALDQKDCEGAIEMLNRGMAAKEVRSFYLAGQMFEYGVCLRKDPAKAASVYQQAALLGDTSAARSLALLDARGSGVPQDYPLAGYWLAVAAQQQPASTSPDLSKFASPDAVARTYVDAVHALAEQGMVYPQAAAAKGVRGKVVMHFDPRTGGVSVVSSQDDRGSSSDHLGPNKHLFEHALSESYDVAIVALPKPALPGGDLASDHEVRFDRNRNSRDGPSGSQDLRR